MESKQKYGQFMTKNAEYILQNIEIPEKVKNIIEPFCGEGDLVKDILEKYTVECYDIQPKNHYTVLRDTIDDPPDYSGKFIITNPPYLARNKSSDKKIFDKYKTNDLYKCFIIELLTNVPDGGIIIVPLNFWSSIRKSDIKLRKDFLITYSVLVLNIFNERVFEDTSYTVCSFLFEKKKNSMPINVNIFPYKKTFDIVLDKRNNYTIGGEIYNVGKKSSYTITRLITKNKESANNNILIKCIDDNSDSMIGLSLVKQVYVDETPNSSARTYASVIIEPPLDQNKQKELVENFNNYLNTQRLKYDSLFLTNYRESKDIARKRISFDLAYNIIRHVLE